MGGTRPYRSGLREAQAAATRARILDAAAGEFSERGFAGTTLGVIATTAGVSVETVKLQGAKHELLLAAWEQQLGSPKNQSAFLDDAGFRAMTMEIPDETLVSTLAEQAADISRRGHGLWLALTAAAQTDESLRAEVESQQSRRLREFGLVIDEFARRSLLRIDRSKADLAVGLAFLASSEGYNELVNRSGFSHDQYRDWLADAITRLITRPSPRPVGTGANTESTHHESDHSDR